MPADKLAQLNRLLALIQDAKEQGVFDPSTFDDPAQADINAEIRELTAELVDTVATGAF
jgi:hypothetical protein